MNENVGFSSPRKDGDKQSEWALVGEGGWLNGHRFPLREHTVLGRDTDCDIAISSTHLSRQHAELAIQKDKLLIRDLKSSNGTFINDQRINTAELKPGDKVRFDVLVFTVDGPGGGSTKGYGNIGTDNANSTSDLPANDESGNTGKDNSAADKRWKTRPTSVGNRNTTVKMPTIKKASESLWMILASGLCIAALLALVYLFTQL